MSTDTNKDQKRMSIADTLAAAKAEADKAAPASSQAVVPAAGSFSPPATRQKMSMDDFRNSARTNVDKYLKVNENGMTIGASKQLIETLKATIKMSDLKYCVQVRFGQPPVYFKTYDNVKSTDGKPWSDVLAQAKAVKNDRSTDPYPTAELVFAVSETPVDVKNQPVKEVTPGTTLGYTPPYTGSPEIASLIDAVEAAGGNPQVDTVNVTLTSDSTTRNGNTWGNVKIKFESLV